LPPEAGCASWAVVVDQDPGLEDAVACGGGAAGGSRAACGAGLGAGRDCSACTCVEKAEIAAVSREEVPLCANSWSTVPLPPAFRAAAI
jgi:hypothetical protein